MKSLLHLAWPIIVLASTPVQAESLIDVKPRPLARVPAGTVVTPKGGSGWSHTLLYARPRLGSGDVSKAPGLAAKYTSQFHFVIMANVTSEITEEGKRFVLDRLAIGYAVDINGKNVVITSDTQKKLGANLDLIGRQVFAENEKCLADIRQVAKYRTIAIFDAEAVVLVNGTHREMVVRHMVSVDPRTGSPSMLVWLLGDDGRGGYRFSGNSMRLVGAGFQEDRVINVNADKFSFGLPTKEAFALASLPEGKEIPVTNKFQAAASVKTFDGNALARLATESNVMLKQMASR